MVGDVIYPLNELARVAPDAYELQRQKYVGREAVFDARICDDWLFTDTVHCAPLHPYRLYSARRKLGFNPPPARKARKHVGGLFFYEIPVEQIVTHPTFWYRWETPWINGYPGEDVAAAPPLDEFEPFDIENYRELPDVPDAHRAYLRRMKDQGKRPLMFVHIPHVLIARPINVSGFQVVPWDEPPSDQ